MNYENLTVSDLLAEAFAGEELEGRCDAMHELVKRFHEKSAPESLLHYMAVYPCTQDGVEGYSTCEFGAAPEHIDPSIIHVMAGTETAKRIHLARAARLAMEDLRERFGENG